MLNLHLNIIMMNKNLLFLFLLVFSTNSFGVKAQIQFLSDSVSKIEIPIPADEIVAKNFIQNVSSTTTITYRWWRVFEDIPSSWGASSICDETVCHFPTVNTNELTIEPGDSALLDVHFLNGGRSGEGLVELLVFDVADSAGTVVFAKYYGKAEAPNSVASFEKYKVEIYPNPTSNVLNVRGLENIQSYSAKVEIYSIIGLKAYESSFTQNSIDVSKLQDGVYMIKILNEKGQQVLTKTFVKK